MNVQRYGIEEHQEEYPPAEMVESFDGDYVLHSDYAALEERCAELRQERDAAFQEVHTVRNEAQGVYSKNGVLIVENRALQAKLAVYESHGSDGHNVTNAQFVEVRDKLAAAEEALREIYNGLVEINLNNHDEDDVFTQNNSVIESIQIADAILAALPVPAEVEVVARVEGE